MRLSTAKSAVIALIIANIIWGAAPPIFKWSLEGIPLYTLAFLRFLIPTLLIGFFVRKPLAIQRKDYRKIFYMAYCLITLNILFLFLGVQRTVSINASIIASAGPIFLIFGSLFFLKEKISRGTFVGNFIGFLGVFIIIFEPLLQNSQAGSILGNFFLLLSTLAIVGGTILAKEIVKDYHPVTIAFWSFAIGTVTFLPMFILEVAHIGFLSSVTINGVIGIIFGSLLSSLTAYVLFFWSLKYFPASETGVFTYIDPITTVFVAIPLLHEPVTETFLLGSLFVFAGIYIAEKRIHWHPIHKLWEQTGPPKPGFMKKYHIKVSLTKDNHKAIK